MAFGISAGIVSAIVALGVAELIAGSSSADATSPSEPRDPDEQSPTDAPRASRRELPRFARWLRSSDPVAVRVRTKIMSSPLLTVQGMLDSRSTPSIERLLDRAVVDGDGRLLVAMVDMLALVRVAVDADVLLVEFDNGASRASRMQELIERDDVFLRLQRAEPLGAQSDGWAARLWSNQTGSSAPIISIRAMSFASFVGLA